MIKYNNIKSKMQFSLNFLFIVLVLISCQILMADAVFLRASKGDSGWGVQCLKDSDCASNKCTNANMFMKVCTHPK